MKISDAKIKLYVTGRKKPRIRCKVLEFGRKPKSREFGNVRVYIQLPAGVGLRDLRGLVRIDEVIDKNFWRVLHKRK